MQKVKHQVRKLSQVISLLRGQKTRRNAHSNPALSVVIIMSQREFKLALCRDYFSFT